MSGLDFGIVLTTVMVSLTTEFSPAIPNAMLVGYNACN
jgi:hypothetical protein